MLYKDYLSSKHWKAEGLELLMCYSGFNEVKGVKTTKTMQKLQKKILS